MAVYSRKFGDVNIAPQIALRLEHEHTTENKESVITVVSFGKPFNSAKRTAALGAITNTV